MLTCRKLADRAAEAPRVLNLCCCCSCAVVDPVVADADVLASAPVEDEVPASSDSGCLTLSISCCYCLSSLVSVRVGWKEREPVEVRRRARVVDMLPFARRGASAFHHLARARQRGGRDAHLTRFRHAVDWSGKASEPLEAFGTSLGAVVVSLARSLRRGRIA